MIGCDDGESTTVHAIIQIEARDSSGQHMVLKMDQLMKG